MSSEFKNEWQRIEFENTPIYIRPDGPDWFVPNQSADRFFVDLATHEKEPADIRFLLKRLRGLSGLTYQSREEKMNLKGLKECWIHITNTCNMQCGHCMFQSSPRSREELSSGDCMAVIDESYKLGCRIYYFTGGEPFISRAFMKSVRHAFQFPDTHVVVLTNLSLISRAKDSLRSLPQDRFHFQVSMDGLKNNHDDLRGDGAFDHLDENLHTLQGLGFPVTLSMTVTRKNWDEMAAVIDLASTHGISNVHFLWLFKKGNADDALFAEPAQIFPRLVAAQENAAKKGVTIDNIEILKSQVFSCPGTRYDLSNAGWQSIAVAPDGTIYPTPALIYTEDMACGHIHEGLENVWKNSPVLKRIRSASLNQSDLYRENPFRYLVGGGDIDHSYIHSGNITGHDPYVALYNLVIQWIISHESRMFSTDGYPAFKLKMGERIGECPVESGTVFFTHSNCVLSLPGHDTRHQVNQFYSEAALETKEDIVNPICYDEKWISHIPAAMRFRSYGCGSPVLDADIKKGEAVLDLGSGTGIECFIASRITGPQGRVVGIDMGDAMLGVANQSKRAVIKNLQYDNIEFRKAFLEFIPLEDSVADVIISNCVLNLSSDKRQVFQEIMRVLKPEGRLVVSDITYDDDLPLEIKYNETLRGECIGGALRYDELFGLLNDIGFSNSKIQKGYLYRSVKGFDFYSVTYQAIKPLAGQKPVLYTFPDFKPLLAEVETEPTCACFLAPRETGTTDPIVTQVHRGGCMVCGSELVYHETSQDKACYYCQQVKPSNGRCANNGHFVCDACHSKDAVEIIRQICLHNKEQDAINLMQMIRSHPHFGLHGPEHHSLVPAVILTALRNSGDTITHDHILTGIQRGQTIAGGSCAFLGICGAAVGVGIAFSILLQADPYKGDERQAVQQVTHQVLGKISSYNAPRCCQRDVWLALTEASRLMKDIRGKQLIVDQTIVCRQFPQNKECIRNQCPLWPSQ
ncbi:MAG: methyltransferase domain-containing protein [Proteobacteria bacterium]|nr:methyltransferase domain-containing protein [Pseudomonadota bacterium]